MSKRRVGAILLAAIVIALAVFAIITLNNKKGGEEDEEILSDVGVHVGKITRATLRRYVAAYGTVEPAPPRDGQPAAGAFISAPVGGILAEIKCAEGQSVVRGAILFRLDSRVAEVAVAKAAEALKSAEQTYERQKKLLAADGTSQKSFQEAELQYQTARSELAAAQTELSLLEIKAPLAGTVVRLNVRFGQSVETNAVLAEVIAFDHLVATAQVPSREAALLKSGQRVEFGEAGTAAGTLTVIAKDIDPKTDTVLVQASLPPDAGFRPGQFVNLRIVAEERRDVLAVPEESVVPGPEGGPVLMMVEGEKAVPKPVKAGLKDAGLVEVEGEGLAEGQVIVTTDAYNFTGETRIHILEDKKNS